MMKSVNFIFLGYSVITVFLLMLIGVAIGERSLLGTLGAATGAVIMVGFGFMTRKKLREKGKI